MNLANSIVTLQPGMYILRHPKTGMPPISIGRAAVKAEHNGQIQALYTPGTDGGVLRDRRDCIVMQVVNAPVDLLVTAYLEIAGAAVPALQIDKIQLEGEGGSQKSFEVPPEGISLVGHIERTGDVIAAPGHTLGTPSGNLRLEGFQVLWPDKPDDVQLNYSAQVDGAGESSVVGVGGFCGTRNAAQRVIGVTFTLAGANAGKYELKGTAHFSGGYSEPVKSGATLQGPSGVEHLTALSLSVEPKQLGGGNKRSNPWDAGARTKVFKAAPAGKKARKTK